MPSSCTKRKQQGKGASSGAFPRIRDSTGSFLLPPPELSLKPGLLEPPPSSPDVLLSLIPLSTERSNSRQPSQWVKDRLFKTKVCRYFIKGRCKYGEKCTYAHSADEVQARPDLHKTRTCYKINCTNKSCPFAHSIYELRDPIVGSELIPHQASLHGQGNGNPHSMTFDQTMPGELITAAAAEESSTSQATFGLASILAPTTLFWCESQDAPFAT